MFRTRTFLKNARKGSSLAAIGLSALVLVSCGGDDDEDETPTAAPATDPPAATEVVTEEVEASPSEMGPGESLASPGMDIATPVASPLVAGATPVDTGVPVDSATPDIAATPGGVEPVVASPLAATPAASPVASPEATPVN